MIENLRAMLAKEAGRGGSRRGANVHAHDPTDYLQENFNGSIQAEVREEAVLSILQFAVQTKCLDQTVLQAV